MNRIRIRPFLLGIIALTLVALMLAVVIGAHFADLASALHGTVTVDDRVVLQWPEQSHAPWALPVVALGIVLLAILLLVLPVVVVVAVLCGLALPLALVALALGIGVAAAAAVVLLVAAPLWLPILLLVWLLRRGRTSAAPVASIAA